MQQPTKRSQSEKLSFRGRQRLNNTCELTIGGAAFATQFSARTAHRARNRRGVGLLAHSDHGIAKKGVTVKSKQSSKKKKNTEYLVESVGNSSCVLETDENAVCDNSYINVKTQRNSNSIPETVPLQKLRLHGHCGLASELMGIFIHCINISNST